MINFEADFEKVRTWTEPTLQTYHLKKFLSS